LEKFSIYIYVFGNLSSIGLKFSRPWIAAIIKGAKGWFQLGPVTLQPWEFRKMGLFRWRASVFSKAGPKGSPWGRGEV
ncbi:FtsW/RodA/SpoVE family cell cycle protein, partial [Bacillus sp. GbtcB13]|uniref:FtsW/RodA/SpoVE family cell cycle protein n=1 Tax=Bacillus sp. GbtcB13 TaxID=2824758 RepID=UPI001C2F80C4